MSNNIAVSITADVADLQVKRAIMSAELKAATKDLNTFAREASATGSTSALREGMLASAGAVEKARASLAQVNVEMVKTSMAAQHAGHEAHEAGNGFLHMAREVHEAAESVRTFQMRAKEFAEVYVAMFAVERIKEFSDHIGEAAEKTRHLGETLGMTVPEVKGLENVATLSGTSVDVLGRALGIMDKGLVTSKGATSAAANAFKAMGVSIDDGRSHMQKILIVADKFKDMDDGPKKVALAMLLFGKAGKEMIPFLDQGASGIQALDAETQKYSAGVLIATAANKGLRDWLAEVNAKGSELAEANNKSKVAWAGIANVLTDALAPVLKTISEKLSEFSKAFIDSYREGGVAKIVFDGLVDTLTVLGRAVEGVAELMKPLGDAVKVISDNFDVFAPIIAGVAAAIAIPYIAAVLSATIATISYSGAMMGLKLAFEMEGLIGVVTTAFSLLTGGLVAAATAAWAFTAALLANPLTWVAIACGVVVAELVKVARETSTVKDFFIVLGDDCKIVFESIKGGVEAVGTALAALAVIAEKVWSLDFAGAQATWKAGLKTIEDNVRTTAKNIKAIQDDIAKHIVYPGAKPEAKPVPAAKPALFDPELGATHKAKKAKADKGPSDVEIWKQQLAEKLLLEENWGVNEAAFSLAFWEQKLKLAKKGSKEELELRHEVSTLKRTLGKEETQEELARIRELTAAAIDSAKTDVEVAKLALQSKIQAAEEAAKAGQISAVQLAQIKRELNAELYQLDADLENRTYALKLKSLQADLAVAHLGAQQKKLINDQIDLLNTQHQNAMTVANAKGNKDRARDDAAVADAQRARWKGVAKTFGDALGQMATFQKSFAATIGSLWQSLQNTISQAISRMVQNWIVALATQQVASEARHLREVVMHAKSGAAAAYHAIVGIPVVGPILAPIAAATAFAGIMAFSAEGGMGAVPYDNAPFLLHKNEMVLPANLATPLRSMLTSPAANNNTPAAANDGGGGNTYNFHVTAMDGQSVKRVLMDNRHHVAGAVSKSVRDGFQR